VRVPRLRVEPRPLLAQPLGDLLEGFALREHLLQAAQCGREAALEQADALHNGRVALR